VYLLWPVGNAQIGRNSLQTLQKRTPLQSGTVVSLEEFTTSGSSGLTQPDSSTSESESLSLAVKWVYFEDDELHAVGVEEGWSGAACHTVGSVGLRELESEFSDACQ
jgi:hypothetical protein